MNPPPDIPSVGKLLSLLFSQDRWHLDVGGIIGITNPKHWVGCAFGLKANSVPCCGASVVIGIERIEAKDFGYIAASRTVDDLGNGLGEVRGGNRAGVVLDLPNGSWAIAIPQELIDGGQGRMKFLPVKG